MVPKSESNTYLNNLNTLQDSQEELCCQEIYSVHSKISSLDDVKILTNSRKESADLSAASSEEFEVTDKEKQLYIDQIDESEISVEQNAMARSIRSEDVGDQHSIVPHDRQIVNVENLDISFQDDAHSKVSVHIAQ